MAIVAGDIIFRLSGGAANSDPNASLGGIMSTTTAIADASVENLFDNVSGAESTSGDTEYRGFYVLNNHGSLTWQTVVLWISTETPSADSLINLALAGEGLNATMETIADESTAPIGESFTHPTTEGAGLAIGNMPFGNRFGIWVERVISAVAGAADADAAIMTFKGDTAA